MKLSQLALLLLPAWACAYTEADYDTGKVHQMIMDRKHVSFTRNVVVANADLFRRHHGTSTESGANTTARNGSRSSRITRTRMSSGAIAEVLQSLNLAILQRLSDART